MHRLRRVLPRCVDTNRAHEKPTSTFHRTPVIRIRCRCWSALLTNGGSPTCNLWPCGINTHTRARTDFKNRGRAVSMTRLDQLAQPTRRKGEHIRAIIERERKHHIESNMAGDRAASARKMSRSLTHLSSTSSARSAAPLRLYQSVTSKSSNQIRPLRKLNATKSMTQLVTAKLLSTPTATPTVVQARKSQAHAIQIEIDTRTTNVSAAGVFYSLSLSQFRSTLRLADLLLNRF